MNIPFYKMHGAANDFILVDDRSGSFPGEDRAWLAQVARRNTGIGSEGVILIQPSDEADFRMRFYNPDGNEVEMCGNGARCVARLAQELGVAPAVMRFETMAGMVGAQMLSEDIVRLRMTEPTDWNLDGVLDLEGPSLNYRSVNSGVPHVVIEVEDVGEVDVMGLGAAVRYHPRFAPAGTNVNFVQVTGSQSIRIRTYERGVEGETPACGTGMVAGALLSGQGGRVTAPVEVIPASGDRLEVDFTPSGEGATAVTLTGPAVHVFQGTLEYPGPGDTSGG